MEFRFDGKTLRFGKSLSELDRFVLGFAKEIKSSRIPYVVVSGYVSILLGRSRSTEDIDMLIGRISFPRLRSLLDSLERKGYECIDSESARDAFDRLQKNLSIRIARRHTVIPNFEIKFAKSETDITPLKNPLKAVINRTELLVSPLEIQIPYKVWLGSEKDLEDAVYLYELFKEKLDRGTMRAISKDLKITKKMIKYGIV